MSEDDETTPPTFIPQDEPFRWRGVTELRYKQDDSSPFSDVTRRVLFDVDRGLGIRVRYSEVAPGGWSTLEHHGHAHEVIPIRGEGDILVQDHLVHARPHDLVYIPGWSWHQLRATGDEPFGFICIVTAESDRPVLPTPEQIEEIRASGPEVAAFIRH